MTTVLTREDQTDILARYLPGGRAFGSKFVPTSNLRLLLRGLAEEIFRVDESVRTFRSDIVPDQTEFFIEDWEAALGIPDACFAGTGTDTERRRDIVTKLAALGIQTADDFENLASKFGITVEVIAGGVHGIFPFEFPFFLFPSEKAARHTIIVNFLSIPSSTFFFPYTFPIIFENPGPAIIECLFRKLKPANCDIIFASF